MTTTAFIGLETATSLLVAYETLALAYTRASRQEKYAAEFAGRNSNEHINYNNSFALLIINAAIIEGTFRSILSGRIVDEIKSTIKERKSHGATEQSKAEMLLDKYHNEVEIKGGWQKIKEQYIFYFDLSIDKLMGNDLKDAINVLFTLRNILGHGTAIVLPKSRMIDSEKDLYPYVWQCKLQGVSDYLEKIYGGGDVLKNLANFDVPVHFMSKTKELFIKLESELTSIPPNSQRTIDKLKKYSFGYAQSMS